MFVFVTVSIHFLTDVVQTLMFFELNKWVDLRLLWPEPCNDAVSWLTDWLTDWVTTRHKSCEGQALQNLATAIWHKSSAMASDGLQRLIHTTAPLVSVTFCNGFVAIRSPITNMWLECCFRFSFWNELCGMTSTQVFLWKWVQTFWSIDSIVLAQLQYTHITSNQSQVGTQLHSVRNPRLCASEMRLVLDSDPSQSTHAGSWWCPSSLVIIWGWPQYGL